MPLFIQAAHAAETVPAPNPIIQFAMPLLLVVFFYIFLIRPHKKREKEHKSMVDSLQEGSEVIFAGGLMGKIEKLEGDYAVISLNKNNEIKIQRAAVISTLPAGTLDNIS